MRINGSTTASDNGQRHRRLYNLAVDEVSVSEFGGLLFSAPSSYPGGRQSSRSKRGKELPCQGIGDSGSYSSRENAPGRDFATRSRDRSDIKPGSKTVFRW